jgi:predicted RNA-binding protein Jag
MASGFSIFKQKIREKFDGDMKTKDADDQVERIKVLNVNEKKIKQYMTTAQEWIENVADVMGSQMTMSTALEVLY